ncbi:type 4a pilus biogenesis protein PilO [Salinisphaera sp. P385]|uniref:Type 4a pilus biogenesis protein PilO n=1 Tax=Spectribacter acetivorans TaxID=3075603 RepID=A0ABU3BC20_9GAMM|nr:type 4a pilus biogenesis protein PilO [Salinisphaera sp. P385]MDT0619683.1 type 4a pilus biogenesis protein PilO [Salinisphaera sp. P385]
MRLNEFVDELRALDQHNVGSWPTWAYVGAVVIVSAVLLGLGSWYFVLPKGDELDRARQQETSLRAEFERKQKKVANLDAYKEQLAEMRQTFGDLLRQLPSQTEVPNLLNDISQTRLASGLEEELFKPRPELVKDFYAVLPNDLVVTGSYHELGAFVSGVAALPRIVTLDNVSIQPAEDSQGGELRMSVVANTYRYLDGDETAGTTEDDQ